MGTVEWLIENDTGKLHNIRIPNSVYSAGNKSKLHSPQHWIQEAKDRYPIKNGTWCATGSSHYTLLGSAEVPKDSPTDAK